MLMHNIDHDEYYGLCSCGCGRPATIADQLGQFADTACRDAYYEPLAWMDTTDRSPSELADENFKKLAQRKEQSL